MLTGTSVPCPRRVECALRDWAPAGCEVVALQQALPTREVAVVNGVRLGSGDAEHLLGRSALQRAIDKVAHHQGCRAPSGTIGRAGNGAPLMPPGFVGSISHSGGLAVAVAALSGGPVVAAGPIVSLGVDLETGSVPASALHLFTSEEERRRLGPLMSQGACSARLLFSAKEAAFKALSPYIPGGSGGLARVVLGAGNARQWGGTVLFGARTPASPRHVALIWGTDEPWGAVAWAGVVVLRARSLARCTADCL